MQRSAETGGDNAGTVPSESGGELAHAIAALFFENRTRRNADT